eukprot:maker-scaffold320_size207635-snap-gene-1.17 protein:Tk09317 transcript:maker-scaffold320_size207635-snap-gene-1.17-mRNA-1 annotation:"amyloid beta protein-binding member 1interacting"
MDRHGKIVTGPRRGQNWNANSSPLLPPLTLGMAGMACSLALAGLAKADELQRQRKESSEISMSPMRQKMECERNEHDINVVSEIEDGSHTDPEQMLNTWLGQLELLQKGLDVTRGPQNFSITDGKSMSPTTFPKPIRSNNTIVPLDVSHQVGRSIIKESSIGVPDHLRRMSTPRMESPRLDSDRFSLMNLEETLDNDLDIILGELCELETKIQTPLKVKSRLSPVLRSLAAPIAQPSMPSSLHQGENIVMEPEYISAESVRQKKSQFRRASSPDTDSAFCENISSNSSNNSESQQRSSSSASTVVEVISHPDHRYSQEEEFMEDAMKPKNVAHLRSLIHSEGITTAKAEKIRLALEKIKEASVKKIFIKVFGEDGSTKSLLVDERMTVNQVCRLLAEKNHVKRHPMWALVELLPDLHMERAFEDHEKLVENLLMWKADSKNTLWFIKRPEVYDVFYRPEMYLLDDTSSQIGTPMDITSRSQLLAEYFSGAGVGAPEVDGHLWLKAEGKKTWKRFFFVLRTSGLYYAPKGKKSSKDLVCLARLDMNQVYFGVKWQPKFKAPTKHGLAIKHPKIQTKNPKYMRYLCADSEEEMNKWVTGIRLAKYGKALHYNFKSITEEVAIGKMDRAVASQSATMDGGSPASEMKTIPLVISHAETNDGIKFKIDAIQDNKPTRPFTTVVVHSSRAKGVHCHSSQTSLRAGMTTNPHDRELIFNCDSPKVPEKRHNPSQSSSGLCECKTSINSTNPSTCAPAEKVPKEVRFLETFSFSPLPVSHSTIPYATMKKDKYPMLKAAEKGLSYARGNDSNGGQNIEDTLASHKQVLEQSNIYRESGILRRRYSNESINSLHTTLHCGVVIQKPTSMTPSPEPHMSSHQEELSPQPSRPAPILKPTLSRKPILDKKMLEKTQKFNGMSKDTATDQTKPTYEDTLKKCQSLTIANLSVASPPQSTGFSKATCSPEVDHVSAKSLGPYEGPIHSSKPSASPPVPPKPNLGLKPPGSSKLLENNNKIAHLPPSGLAFSRPQNHLRSCTGRHQPVNDNGTNVRLGKHKQADLEQFRPFPNRNSSGEYDNVKSQM